MQHAAQGPCAAAHPTRCFDFSSFAQLAKQRKMRCPFCSAAFSADELQINSTVTKILLLSDASVLRVQMRGDGTWSPVQEAKPNINVIELE
jgi:hypothetical protein